MNIAFVVQRFSPDIIGGAESHAWNLARRLAVLQGISVTVFTTTCKDYTTWESFFPAGESVLSGIKVKRFRPRFGRSRRFFPLVSRVVLFFHKRLPEQSRIRSMVEQLWIMLQGPYCPDLVCEVGKLASNFQRIYLFTYLYYPSLFSALKYSGCIFIPTAHDEYPFSFQLVGDALSNCAMLFPNTGVEAELIARVHGISDKKMRVVGAGVNKCADPERGAHRIIEKASGQKWLLYLGRINGAKGIQVLIDLMARIETSQPSLRLILAGPMEESRLSIAIKARWNVVYLGEVTEEVKWMLLHDADVVINPSKYESLSLLVLEAIGAGKPVLLEAATPVFQRYAEVFPTAFLFDSIEALEERVSACLSEEFATRYAERLDESSRKMQDQYSWEAVIERFLDY